MLPWVSTGLGHLFKALAGFFLMLSQAVRTCTSNLIKAVAVCSYLPVGLGPYHSACLAPQCSWLDKPACQLCDLSFCGKGGL